MKELKNNFVGLTLIVSLFFLSACTENPFGGDNEISSRRTVSGQVNLQNNSNSAGLYVWLEGLNAASYTNQDGRFQITVPPPSGQPGGGFTGVANLYYYMANFKLDSSQLVLRDGEFLYSQGEINEKGEFRETRSINKILNIRTALSPSIFDTTFSGQIQATITIDVLANQVNFSTFRSDSQFFTIAAVQRINSSENFVRTLLSGVFMVDTTLVQGQHTFTVAYPFAANSFPAGDYLLMPYLWIEQEGLPRELIHSLDTFYGVYDPSYVNLPFQREGGNFTVR